MEINKELEGQARETIMALPEKHFTSVYDIAGKIGSRNSRDAIRAAGEASRKLHGYIRESDGRTWIAKADGGSWLMKKHVEPEPFVKPDYRAR